MKNGSKAVLSIQVKLPHLLFWPNNDFLRHVTDPYNCGFTQIRVSTKTVNERTPDEYHIICSTNGEIEICFDLTSAEVVQ